MGERRRAAFWLIVLSGLVILPDAAAASLRAGAAKRELVPPMPVPLAGYSRRHGEPADGVHDPLFARALVVEDDDTRVALVSCDVLVIDEFVFDAVQTRLRRAGEATTTLMLAATHTHSGPGGYGKKFLEQLSMGRFSQPVFEFLVERIAEAVTEAAERLQPATIRAASVQTDGLIVNRMVDGGVVDPELSAVLIEQLSHEPLAVLVNFSAHPTTLGAWNMQLSADYPGALTRLIEARYPDALCLFLVGAVGDQAPVKQGEQFAPAEHLGGELARHVLALLGAPAASHKAGEVSARQRTVKLPRARVRLGWLRIPSWLGQALVDDDATLTTVAVGPAMLIGVPCDLSAELGLELKAHARQRGWHPLIVGFANDYIGYCLPERLYHTKTYEASLAFNGPTTGPRLMADLKQMIDQHTRAAHVERRDGLPIVFLEGSPYELGRQHGELLKDEVRESAGRILGYFRTYLKFPLINRLVTNWWLDRAWQEAMPLLPREHLDELRGLSEGSGVPLRELWRVHAIPDRTYACSGFIAWGRATADGRLIHTRNLDWNIGVGVQRHAAVFVVRPEGKKAFVNVGWAGFIGVLTGVNEEGISIGQIGAQTADLSSHGLPMTFLMRRVLEESGGLDDAVRLITEAPRTVGVNYLIADATAGRGVAIETTHRLSSVFEANDPKEREVADARPMEDVVLRADTAMDPAIRDRQIASGGKPNQPGLEPPTGSAYTVRYLKQAEGIAASYGRIDAETAQEIMKSIAPDSNVQSVVFAWPQMWVANAQDTTPAAQTPYSRLDLEELFGAQPQ